MEGGGGTEGGVWKGESEGKGEVAEEGDYGLLIVKWKVVQWFTEFVQLS